MLQHYYKFSQVLTFSGVLWYDNSNIRAPACYQSYLLKPEYIDGLFPMCHALCPEIRNIDISDLHFTMKKFSSICIGSEKFGSKGESRNLRSARVLVSWHTGDGSISPTSPLAPEVVDYYICHRLTLNSVEGEHYFAFTRLVKKHPNKHNLGCLNTLPVWDATNFEKIHPASFLPVHLIHSHFTGTTLSADIVKLMVVCPIPRRANISFAN